MAEGNLGELIDFRPLAYHEAGHALVAYLLSANLEYIKEDLFSAETEYDTWGLEPDEVRKIALAGPVAEMIWKGGGIIEPNDQARFAKTLEPSYSTEMGQAVMREVISDLQAFLKQPQVWIVIEALAKELAEKRFLSGKDCTQMLDQLLKADKRWEYQCALKPIL